MKISGVRMSQKERVDHENVYWRNGRDESVLPHPACLVSHVTGWALTSLNKHVVNVPEASGKVNTVHGLLELTIYKRKYTLNI